MTVNTTNITSGPYSGNGTASQFSYGFRVENKNQLTVYETDDSVPPVTVALTVDTDYTVNNIGTDGGGTIDRVAGALPAGYSWYIRSNYPYTQDTDFDSQSGFFPDVHEKAFDKLTFQNQQIKDVVSRAIRYPESASGIIDATLPDPEANKVLVWDATATGLTNGPSEGDFQSYASSASASADAASASASAASASVDEVSDQKIVWKGAHNGSTTYSLNDAVSEDGASYIYINATPSSGNTPPNGTYWDVLASKGSPGAGTGDMVAANNLSDVANPVTAKSNLGMANVDNTSDADKPVSTAQSTALGLKADLASPTFSGTPTAPTATAGTNTTQLATTAFVQAVAGATTGTSTDTSSGSTSYDYSSLPAGITKITIMMGEVSVSGTSSIMLQLGDSGGFETTGYNSTADFVEDNNVASVFTSGLGLTNVSVASSIYSGVVTLTRLTGNQWVYSSVLNTGTNSLQLGAGTKTLSGELTQLRLTTVDGTDTFDGGDFNIRYE